MFKREWEGERVYVAVNATDQDFWAGFDAGTSQATDLISGNAVELNGGLNIPAYTAFFLKA